MTRATTRKPDWLDEGPPSESLVERAQDEAWDEHTAAIREDEALPEELPGGTAWQAVYDEATAAAGGDPRDLWNRLSEEERGRYATLAAMQRRWRREHSSERPTASERNNPLPFLSARELAAQTPPDVPWVVRHYLARGALTELDGRAKRAGKTTLLGHLFKAILHRLPFLGQTTERVPIVMLTEMADTPLRQLLERTGLTEEDDLRILRWTDARLVRWPDVVADSIEECTQYGAGLFVVDTLPQWAGIRGDAENDAGAALAAIEPLQAAAAGGLAVALVRHERKGGGDVGESGRGSTAFTGAVDIVVRLAQPLNPVRETIRQLSILSRFDGAPNDLMIELTEDGYEVLGEEAAVVFASARNDLADILPDHPASMTMAEILTRIEAGRSTIDAALRALVAAGQVVRTGTGRRGTPFAWSRVPAGDPSILSLGDPLKGVSPQTRRNGAAAVPANVASRMADIFAGAPTHDVVDEQLEPDEPDDPEVSEPDYLAGLFEPPLQGFPA